MPLARHSAGLVACSLALAFFDAQGADAISPQEMAAAVKLDAVTVPTPGELFAAIDKQRQPNWASQARSSIPTNFTNRAQLALNVGGLIADGFIAVEAQDSQQVKNVGKDIIALAKALGISQNLIARGNSITEFAENNEWNTLKEELDATQNEVKSAMEAQHDEGLITLVSLGGWIRGTQVVSAVIAQNYTQENARLLRQPQLVAFLRSKIDSLPPKMQEEALVKKVNEGMEELQKLVSFPTDKTPGVDDVKKINTLASGLVKIISLKKN